jgi:hypothetical protein
MTLKLINNKSKYRYSILADDTQLFNKNDESVKKSKKPLVQKSIMK